MRTPPADVLARRLPGRRAFITGAGSGLGRAFALDLGRAGWSLGLFDRVEAALRDSAGLVGAQGASVRTWLGDVAEPQAIGSAIAEFAQAAGGLDLLINNAGVALAGAVESTTAQDWRRAVDVNLLGVVYGCRAVAPLMRSQRSGVVLNIASAAGFAAMPNMAAYNAGKAGVIALSETLAAELGEAGVQVSVAMPGFVRTALLDSLRAPEAEAALARQLMSRSRHDAAAASHAILAAVARGRFYVVWPFEYRLLWRFKRWFPGTFLRLAKMLRRSLPALAGSSPPD